MYLFIQYTYLIVSFFNQLKGAIDADEIKVRLNEIGIKMEEYEINQLLHK